MKVLTDEVIASFKDAARKLTGPKRRAFQAQVTLDYLDGSIWKAERVFGWSHHTVALGLNELRTGITCQGNFSARGNHKTETKSPELEADIRALADPESQADPKFQSPFLYTRITAKSLQKLLQQVPLESQHKSHPGLETSGKNTLAPSSSSRLLK